MSTEKSEYPVPASFKSSAKISSISSYHELYEGSVKDPERFWAGMADSELEWSTRATTVCSHDWQTIGESKKPYVSWFSGGTLNVSANCLDRHVAAGRGNKLAIVWEGETAGEKRTLTYSQLLREVCLLANVLKRSGVVQGTTVGIYLPMVPELIISVLACSRIGAIHSVVFSAFSAEALKSRMQDCQAKLLITADGGFYAGRTVAIKEKVDEALEDCPTIEKTIVLNRAGLPINMLSGRDLWWHEEITASDIVDQSMPEAFDAENPLFILYTSGSTGKPKGVLHSSAGYLLFAHLTFKYFFDHREDDVYWCTADVGWITGHSYLVYGPLSNCSTCVMFEGAPLQPNPERTWQIIADNKVTIFYTAPTAIRSFMKLGKELPAKYDLSSLRLLGSVGEPINPEAWRWYYEVIGSGKCPIIDTWWQTETGGVMISTFPGAMTMKPGAAGLPFFGVAPKILKENGEEAKEGEDGILTITSPWPGMLRGVYGDSSNTLIKNTYFSMFPGVFFTGDGARKDSDGFYWLLGRVDDVLNVSAHRFSTAELESALVAHSAIAESAVVGFPHDIKGHGIYCFVTVKAGQQINEKLALELRQQLRNEIGPIATPDKIQFCEALPKTRSGKIMRRVLRKIAEGQIEQIGDISTLADPAVVQALIDGHAF